MKGLRLTLMVALALYPMPKLAFCNTISYLRFEEGNGTSVTDETGLFSGTTSGNSWSNDVPYAVIPQTGQLSSKSLFVGSGVQLDLASNLTLGTSFTIEFFFNLEGIPNTRVYDSFPFLWLMDTDPSNPGRAGSFMEMGLGQPWNPPFPSAAGVGGRVIDTTGNLETYFHTDYFSLSPHTWHHFAFVREGGIGRFYFDGLQVGNVEFGPTPFGSVTFGTTNEYAYLFGDDTLGGATVTGLLDEFRISDEALDPSQFLNAIPEPSTVGLVVLGLGGLSLLLRRKLKTPS